MGKRRTPPWKRTGVAHVRKISALNALARLGEEHERRLAEREAELTKDQEPLRRGSAS